MLLNVNGIVSEVPNEVLFCHAVASGNLLRAQELYPEVDLFKKNDLGITPALFCSWAAYQKDPQAAIDILQTYFPDLRADKKDPQNVDIAQTLLKVVSPKDNSLSSWVANLLMNISAVDPAKISGDEKNQRFVYTCCVAALKFILDINNWAFDGISPKTRELAQKLLQCQWLKPFAEDEFSTEHNNNPEPASLQALMAFLNLNDEETATEAEAHYYLNQKNQQRTCLMSGGPRAHSVNKAAKDLKTCREECENENRVEKISVTRLVN